MDSTNKTLLFDRFLIMYNLCVFTCIIFIFVFRCTHVRMSYVLNSYLLTYLHKYILHLGDALKRFSRPEVKDQGPEQTS